MTSSLLAILTIIRAVNLPVFFLGSLLGSLIARSNRDEFFQSGVWLLSIAAVFLAAAVNTINDIIDIEIDRINRPSRPLVTQAISKTTAFWIYGITISIGLLLPFYYSIQNQTLESFFIALFFAVTGTLYSFYFKQTPLFGNMIVALDVALVIALGASANTTFYDQLSGSSVFALLYAMLFAFFITLLRELLKDMEDINGDRSNNAKTFPVVFGFSQSSSLLLLILGVLFALSLLPYFQGVWGVGYLIFVLISDGVTLYAIFRIYQVRKSEALFFQRVSYSSLMLKLSMVIGLLAIFLGELINL
ncbi:MAG: UbiA family prenyltransferase [Chloroherpetonaceae bacterium]|nr:UbiA family prenyltransferase [Chloroherpetonaceae bacterium]